jgi:glycosyltransferase involved in cell wall biosynthesis/predicted SAM-dependent methyltransferase
MNNFLVFVTVELYPLSTGESGKLIINLLSAMSEMDRTRSIVILADEALDQCLARTTYPEVRFEGLEDVAEVRDSDRYPPKNAYCHTTEWHWRSVCILRKLLKLEQEGLAFDYIEFPDYCGLGFAATQEKLFEGAFAHTALAVRLYGTEGIALSTGERPTGRASLVLHDIERKALRDCNRVITPSMPVADHYHSFYGFDLSEWASRIVLHSLPVPTDNTGVAKSCVVSPDMPLLFLSNLQRNKAPDIFVRACVGFMRLYPEYAGEVHFLSQDKNPEDCVYVEKLIPSDLAHRFKFHDSLIPRAQREQLISQGVSVFSSRCETFCLAAFEASLLGGAVLLNAVNPAFSQLTPWRDAENCIKFDGTVESLVEGLHRLFREGPELAPVSPRSNVVPWEAIAPPVESTGLIESDPEAPLVSVIIPNFNLGAYLPYTLSSVAASGYPNIEIIVCDDASTDPYTIELLGHLEQDFKDRSLSIVYAKYNRGLAGARNLAIRKAKGKYILTLDADDLISPEFIAKAVGALERNPDYSIVVPQTAYFSHERNEIPQTQSEYIGFLLFYGEALANGFFDNRFSTATVLARRALFDELKYREDLRAWEDWDFYLRAVIAGKRFIVTNELHFFYRRRQNSMISEVANDPRHMASCYYDLRRIQTIQSGRLSFPAYAISAWEEVIVAEHSVAEIRRLSDELQELSSIASERDGQMASLAHEVAALRNSTSWPLMKLLSFIMHQIARGKHLVRIVHSAFRIGGGPLVTLRKVFDLYHREGIAGIKRGIRMVQTGAKVGPAVGSDNFDRNDYTEWVRRYDTVDETKRAQLIALCDGLASKPRISVVMPTYNPKPEWLLEAIESVRGQIYPNWELCIADDASPDPAIRPILERYAREDERIKVVFREQNGHISAASNSALALATGEWVALLDHDDVLPEHALYWVADAINSQPNARLIYSDEDKLDENGARFQPYFKCDWNIDLFYAQNMFSHLGVYQNKLLREVGGFRTGFEGSQDYDLALRCIEKVSFQEIHHIPRVLYHWRAHLDSTAMAKQAKPYCQSAGEKALNEHFLRWHIDADVEPTKLGARRVRYRLPKTVPMVSLVIPTRNGLCLLKQCIESIIKKTSYPNYEILIVDNGSDDPEILDYFNEIKSYSNIRILADSRPFNYSELNNAAVKEAKGEIIGLINNDIEVISPDWLSEMVGISIQPKVGAVGAKLWYPNDTIQHGGVLLGIGGIANHAHHKLDKFSAGYFGRAVLSQSFSAVTAACLIIKKSIYVEVGGLNQKDLPVAFNDVDFCLRLRDAGYRNVWTPYAELYHHESASRGKEDTPAKQARAVAEANYMMKAWGNCIFNDPAYSPNLTLDYYNDFSLAWPPRIELLGTCSPLVSRPIPSNRVDKALIMIDRDGLGLEIGPSHNPMAPKKEGFNVHVLDHASAEELRVKYTGHPVNLDNIEEVDFVWRGEPLSELIGREHCYDWIVASHVIEHVTDFVGFLRQCEKLLATKGVISLVVPDKRYCFDYYRWPSNTGDVLQAFTDNRVRHTPGSIFDHFSNVSNMGKRITWSSADRGDIKMVHTLEEAEGNWKQALKNEEYIDCHSWKFTPSSFRIILNDLQKLGLTELVEVGGFDTVGFEFWITLGKRQHNSVIYDRQELSRSMMREIGESIKCLT